MILTRILLVLCTFASGLAEGNSSDSEAVLQDSVDQEYPILMQTRKAAYVRQGALRGSAVSAKVYRGAVLRLAPTGGTRGCDRGWMKRFGGGFICKKHLKGTDAVEARPTPLDNPNLIVGFDAYKVVKHGPKLYRGMKALRKRIPYVKLRQGSVLVVKGKLIRNGKRYLETRQGWYVEAQNLERLPPRIDTLAISVDSEHPTPLGIAIKNAQVFEEPTKKSKALGAIDRWSAIPRDGDSLPEVRRGWVKLGEDRYVRDKDVAVVRPVPIPKGINPDEHWIAVDVREQVMQAFEGERLVKVMPVSTGKKGNTTPGSYRIQWKRRAQTMRLRMGSVRVEDVQWVMYYNRKASIAIHAAYWHHNFGTPVSHGCVNLPIQDARWVFEWTTPHAIPADSEKFPVPGDPGSRVIVF